MDAMLVRSPLASYTFTSSKGINLRVCYQDKSGNIKQSFFDAQSGWYTSPNGIVGKADLNNGLAITGWAGGDEERVYYIGQNDKIVERCWSASKGSWYDGELTGKFATAHYSNLAVMTYDSNGTRCIRVFYQDKDNTIRVAARDGVGAWFSGASFPAAIQGSSIACSYVATGTWNRFVYYQKPDTTFVEHTSQGASGQWAVGGFKSQLVYDPGAYITVASWPSVNHRIFTIDRDNKLCVTEFNASTWAQTKELTGTIPLSAAAATLVAGSTRVRVYLQITPGEIVEWGTDNGTTYSQMKNPLPTN